MATHGYAWLRMAAGRRVQQHDLVHHLWIVVAIGDGQHHQDPHQSWAYSDTEIFQDGSDMIRLKRFLKKWCFFSLGQRCWEKFDISTVQKPAANYNKSQAAKSRGSHDESYDSCHHTCSSGWNSLQPVLSNIQYVPMLSEVLVAHQTVKGTCLQEVQGRYSRSGRSKLLSYLGQFQEFHQFPVDGTLGSSCFWMIYDDLQIQNPLKSEGWQI